MDIAVVNVALVEFDNVGVVDPTEDGQLLLQQLDLLLNILTQNALDGVLNRWITLAPSQAHRSKLPTPDQLLELVHLAHVEVGKLLFDIFEGNLSRTRAPDNDAVLRRGVEDYLFIRVFFFMSSAYLLSASALVVVLTLADLLRLLHGASPRPLSLGVKLSRNLNSWWLDYALPSL